MLRANVYAGAKEQILKGFSNMPEILQAYPSEHLSFQHAGEDNTPNDVGPFHP